MLALLLSITVILEADCTSDEQYANHTIFDLDKKIIKLMLRPEAGKGQETYQSLQKMYNELLNIFEALKAEVGDSKAISLGKEIVKKKTFKIFKAPISEELLKVTYRWSQEFLDQFVELISKCKQLYVKIETQIKIKFF